MDIGGRARRSGGGWRLLAVLGLLLAAIPAVGPQAEAGLLENGVFATGASVGQAPRYASLVQGLATLKRDGHLWRGAGALVVRGARVRDATADDTRPADGGGDSTLPSAP